VIETAAAPGFVERLQNAGKARYHDRHPLHARMHEGAMTPRELAVWAHNRYYYQTRIPIKDSLILAKCEDPAFRRIWLRRIVDQDGEQAEAGGLALWRRLALSLGVSERELDDRDSILPGVRAACDGYVELVRRSSLLEAVAASLTEFFAPDLMKRRLEAWERHYAFLPGEALEYFRVRVGAARRDAGFALEFVVREATTAERQERAIAALVAKADLLWQMADAIDQALGHERGSA
jgi:pyrroloquinoline-quinone synthase